MSTALNCHSGSWQVPHIGVTIILPGYSTLVKTEIFSYSQFNLSLTETPISSFSLPSFDHHWTKYATLRDFRDPYYDIFNAVLTLRFYYIVYQANNVLYEEMLTIKNSAFMMKTWF